MLFIFRYPKIILLASYLIITYNSILINKDISIQAKKCHKEKPSIICIFILVYLFTKPNPSLLPKKMLVTRSKIGFAANLFA